MGIVIGTGGKNINELKQETDTRITSCKGDNSGKESGFIVTGTIIGCENARLAIRHRIVSISVLYTPIFILMSTLQKSYIKNAGHEIHKFPLRFMSLCFYYFVKFAHLYLCMESFLYYLVEVECAHIQ